MFFIYRLTDGELDYYGQTENPERRLESHKTPSNHCRSKLLDKSKMKIHIIHRLYTQEEADETEAFYQLNFECVNKNITGRTSKERNKNFYNNNRESQIIRSQNYYVEHIEEKKEYNKNHYQQEKEYYTTKSAEYYKENIAEIKARKAKPYECECGSIVTSSGKARHIKSKKHRDYINQK
jgi:hypothetical protein